METPGLLVIVMLSFSSKHESAGRAAKSIKLRVPLRQKAQGDTKNKSEGHTKNKSQGDTKNKSQGDTINKIVMLRLPKENFSKHRGWVLSSHKF